MNMGRKKTNLPLLENLAQSRNIVDSCGLGEGGRDGGGGVYSLYIYSEVKFRMRFGYSRNLIKGTVSREREVQKYIGVHKNQNFPPSIPQLSR